MLWRVVWLTWLIDKNFWRRKIVEFFGGEEAIKTFGGWRNDKTFGGGIVQGIIKNKNQKNFFPKLHPLQNASTNVT